MDSVFEGLKFHRYSFRISAAVSSTMMHKLVPSANSDVCVYVNNDVIYGNDNKKESYDGR